MTITRELLRKLGDWRADKEGKALAAAGGVRELDYTGNLLAGVVGNIKARLKLGDGPFGIENLCACRQARVEGVICAHVVALVYAWLDKDKPAANPPPAGPRVDTAGGGAASRPRPVPQPQAVQLPPQRAQLDGALGGLTLTLEPVDERSPLHRAALTAGFVRQGRHYRLSGEPSVGAFLANTLPHWERQWEVARGERLQAFLATCDILRPRVTLQPAGQDWLAVDLALTDDRGAAVLSPTDARRLLQKGVSHQRLPSGRVALAPTTALAEFDAVIFDCQAQQTAAGLRVPRRFGAYLTEAAQANAWQPPAEIAPLAEVALPAWLARQLRPYQLTGVNWLHHLATNRCGGILADEMGLGKTIQALAYLSTRPKTSLVVCPTSLLANWQAEAERFTPTRRALVLHGAERHEAFASIPAHDFVITSYALLRRDAAQYAAVAFDTVILDEAQQIKNRFSQVAQAVKSLRAAQRFVLTGTPLENALTDLWSIVDFLMPGYLGPATEFRERYELPITRAQDAAALRRLRQRLRPFVLRRTKREVAPELPPQTEHVTLCDLTAEQAGVYQGILEQGRRDVFAPAGKGGAAQQRLAMLVTLTRLRQACCHLGLLPAVAGQEWREPSAKLETCLELIDEALSGGHRVLVFSQFTTLLKLVAAALPVPHAYLDGRTVDRAGEIQRFRAAALPVFLISLKAGGTGLNLTEADTVIHLDPWWNPAVEDQATARAHRIGQVNPVTAYKLIARGTVEEKIVRLQERKRELIAKTVTSEEAFIGRLSAEEIRELLA